MTQPWSKQKESFQAMVNGMDPELLQGYKKFLHEVVIQGITRHHLTMDNINTRLFTFNEETIADIVEKAISYYDERAPQDIKTYEMVNSINTQES